MIAGLWQDLGTKRFWRHFATNLFAAIGVATTLLGAVAIFWAKNLNHHKGLVSTLVVVGSLIYALWRSWPRPIRQHYNGANTEIRVVRGDLFDGTANLVIGTCDTFDTATPEIIAQDSVQGQFLTRIYGGDAARLDADLSAALSAATTTGIVEKPGKTARYEIGTVAVLHEGLRRYFCLAYTTMDEQNNAQATMDSIWASLASLWKAVGASANGQPVAIGVIGGGMSRLAQVLPAQDAIRFTMLSFILASRRGRVCERLDIVVRPKEFDRLDKLELQAFLGSLRLS